MNLRTDGVGPRGAAALGEAVRPSSVVELATPAWCWSRLRLTAVGVLSSGPGPRPTSVSVAYTETGGQIVVPVDTEAGDVSSLAGSELTLALTGRTEDGLRWVVRATGTALLSLFEPDSLEACRSSHPSRSGAPLPSDVLLVPVTWLRGYRESPLRTSAGG